MELRLEIDGNWTAEQFGEFFSAFQGLSYYFIADMEYRFAPPNWGGQSIGRLRKQNATLTVKRIQFSSPGFTDLAGFGAILSEIRQFIEFIILRYQNSEDRKLARDERKLSIEEKKLSILRQKIEIARELDEQGIPHSFAKLIEAEGADVVIEAIYEDRLVGVELREQSDQEDI